MRRQLEDAPPGRECPRQLARGGGQRRDGLERDEREQRERRDQHTVERPRVVGGHGQRQHAHGRQARNRDRCRVRDAGDERVPLGEAAELPVGGADPGERLVLPAVGDELRCAGEELDQLRRQLAARRRLAAGRPLGHPRCEERHRDASHHEAGGEHDGRGRQQQRRRDDAGSADDEPGDRRADPADREALQGIDVADHPRQQVPAPEGAELGRSERLDPLVDTRPQRADRAERQVVRGEPVGVPRQRPCEREEADDHDDRRERQDRRLLGSTGDEVPGRRRQRHAEAERERAEPERQHQPAARKVG